jgi:hypothetical protein
MRAVDKQQVEMVTCQLPGDNGPVLIHHDFATEGAHTESHQAPEYRLAVRPDPGEADLEIIFAVPRTRTTWHATM